jgi:beta-glucosidase
MTLSMNISQTPKWVYSSLINFFEPARKWCPVEVLLAKSLHYYWNERFFKRTKGKFDFIGANYYFHDRIVWYPPFKKNEDKWTHDKGWEIYPEGIYQILKYVKKFNKPIYITENGLADREDKHRKEFIKQHLHWTHKAIDEGADVRGYFHWSLLDNFEWDSGYDPKFGLFEVDRVTFERKAKAQREVLCGDL